MKTFLVALAAIGAVVGAAYHLRQSPTGVNQAVGTHPGGIGLSTELKPQPGHELAAFSEGCFWGSENVYRHVKGVTATAVGYTGGTLPNPTYEDVCTHRTGHAETVLVEFDPQIVSYKTLLADFWNSHDPTTPDRQGPDVGSNYRSAIWIFNDNQMKEALQSEAEEQKKLEDRITTQIRPIGKFWMAEDYHQQYDEKNGVAACPVFLRSPGSSH